MVKTEIIEKFSALITGGFGLVAALAWNDAIIKIMQTVWGERGSIGAMLFYATVVTIVAVLATTWIGWAAQKAKEKEIPFLKRKKKEEEAKKEESKK